MDSHVPNIVQERALTLTLTLHNIPFQAGFGTLS